METLVSRKLPDPDAMYQHLLDGEYCGCGKRAVGYVTMALNSGRYRTRCYCGACYEAARKDHRACASMFIEALSR